jgi:hypothetical protein
MDIELALKKLGTEKKLLYGGCWPVFSFSNDAETKDFICATSIRSNTSGSQIEESTSLNCPCRPACKYGNH